MKYIVLFSGAHGYMFCDIENDSIDSIKAKLSEMDYKFETFFVYSSTKSVDELTEENMSEIFNSEFSPKTQRTFYNDLYCQHINLLNFDPDTQCFVCHKCGGVLSGNMTVQHKLCGCISGWVRPYQQPILQENYKLV